MSAQKLYFNSWQVCFTSVAGQFILFNPENILQSSDIPTNPLAPLLVTDKAGNERKIYLGATPSFPFIQVKECSDKAKESIFNQPLVKVSNNHDNIAQTGLRSGGRSALLYSKESNKYYRLKGCGNYVDQNKFRFEFPGIPLKDFEVFGEKIGSEIRGCSFLQPSLRELMMCHKLEEMLKNFSDFDVSLGPLQLGNYPVGYWVYNLDYELQPHPDIVVTCTIFETLGERRLASHLLAGLDILLKYGILEINATEVREKLVHRGGTDSESPITTFSACCAGNFATPHEFVQDADIKLNIGALSRIFDTADDQMKCKWQSLCKEIENTGGETFNSLAFLYWRLGREVGEFLRFLLDNDVMWGYFFDYNPCEPHCNSHPNNFLVLPVTESSPSRFIAPLDFDMTFTKDTFFNPFSNARDDELFDDWKKSELSEMERALGGDIANNGLALEQAEQSKLKESTYPKESFEIASNAMRDTLLAGCRSAYNKKDDSYPATMCKDYKKLFAFVEMALILTSEIQS